MNSGLHLGADTATGEPVRLEPRDLTTHGVCVGMTGSGKTGLGIVLLEEIARAGVPVVAIDTKGDLANLALLFDDLSPTQFAPWLPPAGGVTADDLAARWRDGLAASGLSAADVAQLRRTSPRRLFTPGADFAPIDILSGLDPPELEFEPHAAELRQRIGTFCGALLSLAGIDADPLTSVEHLLLAHILEHDWRTKRPVSLESLIGSIQTPPFEKIGAFELETVLPQAKRLKLALALNTLLSAPTFQSWRTGAPLSPELFLPGPDGQPPTTILYLAHLEEHERQFFLSLFCELINTWMRQQSGGGELRLCLFCDEVVGYLPPHPANPPTKAPLLTLYKQARAFGVGVVVATQNPVDIDYKALTNAGTWLVGRLQTEQDRARLGETLESAVAGAGRADVAATIANLGKREFLITSPSLKPAAVITSRWALSYLAGPLTLPQLPQLAAEGLLVTSEPRPVAPAPEPARSTPPAVAPPSPTPPAEGVALAEYHLSEAREAGGLEAQVMVRARVQYLHQNPPVEHQETLFLRARWEGDPTLTDPRVFLIPPGEIHSGRPPGATLPPELADETLRRRAVEAIGNRVYDKRRVGLWHNPKLELWSEVGVGRATFDQLCQRAVAKLVQEASEQVEDQYQDRLNTLQRRMEKEQREVLEVQDRADLEARSLAVDVGAKVLGSLLGGGRSGRRIASGLSSVNRQKRRSDEWQLRIQREQADVERVESEMAALQEEEQREANEMIARLQAILAETCEVELKPRRQDVAIEEVAMVWVALAE